MYNILITGGAGFLGLNTAVELLKQNCNVVIVDDFKNSYVQHARRVKSVYNNFACCKGDCCDIEFMDKVFEQFKFDIVMHFAAKKYIGESVAKPEEYMRNNINSLKVVMDLSEKYGVKRIIFPSSSSVYGNCEKELIDEDTPLNPMNPYAKTKVIGEAMLQKWSEETEIPATIFRFANPVGANLEYGLGDHSKKRQMPLFPIVSTKAIKDEEIVIRGNDLNTADGTAIRDYIYVGELASIVAFVALNSTDAGVEIFNLGSGGNGFSNLQVVLAAQQALGKPVKYSFAPSNKHEITKMVLDCSKLFTKYKTMPKKTIEEIMDTQIKFVQDLNDKSL